MNKLVFLSAVGAKAKTSYEWTAAKFPEQYGYGFRHSVDSKLLWVEDSAYDATNPSVEYKPALMLGNTNPTLLDADTPHKTRLELIHTDLDGEFNVTSNGPAIMLKDDHVLSTPKGSDMLKLALESEIMLLMAMSDLESEARAVLIGWRPHESTAERIELLLVRGDMSDTKLELVVQGSHVPPISLDLPYDQWDLTLIRNSFDLHIRQGRIEVYVNGEKLHDGALPEFSQGNGYMYMFSPHVSEQTFNIARVHNVRIERTN